MRLNNCTIKKKKKHGLCMSNQNIDIVMRVLDLLILLKLILVKVPYLRLSFKFFIFVFFQQTSRQDLQTRASYTPMLIYFTNDAEEQSLELRKLPHLLIGFKVSNCSVGYFPSYKNIFLYTILCHSYINSKQLFG